MCKKDNIYKIKIDNSSNLSYGTGTTRFAVNMPTYLQEKLYNKKLLWHVETAQLKVVLAGADVGTDNLCIKSSLQQINSYNNTNNNMTQVLCYFSSERKVVVGGASAIISLDYPTSPQVMRGLSPVLEFEIGDSYTEAQVELGANDLWFMVLVIQELEDDKMDNYKTN